MGTIRFVLRTKNAAKANAFAIDLLFQQKGKRKSFRTKERVLETNWDPKNQVVNYIDKKAAKVSDPKIPYNHFPSSKEVDEINASLASLKNAIANIEKKYISNKEIYDAEMVVNRLIETQRSVIQKKEAPVNELFHFIDQYILDHAATREPGSLSVYKALKNHLQHFQTDKKKKVTFENIDYRFFQEFQNYLITSRNLNNTTTAKQLSTIKTFLNYAKLHGHKINDQYKDFKIKKENLEVIALTSEEFDLLYNMDLSGNKKLDQVRDVFCFACTTGLRFSDILQLKKEHIKKDQIRLIVTKTKELLTIPLNPYSQSILAKYENTVKPLPVISNQKTNEYIHELCKLAGINEPVEIVRFRGAKRETAVYPKYDLISVHTGRKTFCTLSLEKGMSAEEVMQISGHKDYQSFKRYVKITEKRTKVVMGKAWGEIIKHNLKAV